MLYYSTKNQSGKVDFKTATIQGQAPDKGLYFPEQTPALDPSFIAQLEQLSNEEIAFRVILPYVGDAIAKDELFRIVSETVNFPIPLQNVTADIAALELFHGPTLAFKDIGARFMSRCLGQFVKDRSKKITVLVATSGDTGGAVADGFFDVDDVEVVILYPSGMVSTVQEKQLTTLGKNITALEVKGTFDDCQQMVKQAFIDEQLRERLFLTSANSINVARWLPQQFYYFFAYKQWKEKDAPPVISVPSGNFGNICAGLLAHHTGLPAAHFIAACNANDVVPRFMETKEFHPQKAKATLSNAMDVGEPSNFIRILELFHHYFPGLQETLTAVSITDEETMAALRDIYNRSGYLADPHGAIGFLALQRYLREHAGMKGFFLETAHPVKFPDAVRQATGVNIPVPPAVESVMNKQKISTVLEPSFQQLKDFLLG